MQIVIRQLPDELREIANQIKAEGGFSSVEAVFREALRQSPVFADQKIDWPEIKKGGARAGSGPKPKKKTAPRKRAK